MIRSVNAILPVTAYWYHMTCDNLLVASYTCTHMGEAGIIHHVARHHLYIMYARTPDIK